MTARKRKKSSVGTLAKIGAALALPIPDVELLIPALMANPQNRGIKFVLGILNKAGKRVSEVQSVLFDKAQWAASDAKKWLKQQGFKIPTADETANFFRFRQKSPTRYKEMRTIEAGKHQNPRETYHEDAYQAGRTGLRYAASKHGTVNLTPSITDKVEWGHAWSDFMRGWNDEKRAKVNPESLPSSLSGHLALTSDPFFRKQTPEIQAAMMTGMDLAESVKRNPVSGASSYTVMVKQGRYWIKEEAGLSLQTASDIAQLQRQMGKQAKVVLARKKNPSSEDDAAALSEQFHGRPAETITTMIEEVEERTNFTELGDLVELKLATLSGYDVTLKFSEKGADVVKLCCSPDGKQLYFLDGDQSVPLDEIHMGAEKWKRDRMILGVLYELTYRTEKGFDHFKLTEYFHKLGEETKQKPMLEYDTLNDHLSVAGGQYRVKDIGICN